MKSKEFSPSLTSLWRITAIMAFLLLACTLLLAVKSRSKSNDGFTGYISSSNDTVYLRSQADDTSRIKAIINKGTSVFVDNSTTRNDMIWYHIKTENSTGWIPEANLSLTTP
jgi:uncharacterized protein YgiM (DUF1202 family)